MVGRLQNDISRISAAGLLALACLAGCDDDPVRQNDDGTSTGTTTNSTVGTPTTSNTNDGTSTTETPEDTTTTGSPGVDDDATSGDDTTTTVDPSDGSTTSTGGAEESSTGETFDTSTGGDADPFECVPASQDGTVRVATFNVSLSNNAGPGALLESLEGDGGTAPQIAEIIQTVCPDIILLNEFDYDEDGEASDLFHDKFLQTPQGDLDVIATYPHRFVVPSNTGLMPETPLDFDNDGNAGQPGGDAFGFGLYEGQYAYVVLSKYPIATDEIRCFQEFLWRDMPGALLPETEAGGFYSGEELGVFRLSSKNHCDVPVEVDGETLHVLASHPTPPTFDGPEDRNGRRNHDEIRLWRDYVSQDADASAYLVDDDGVVGGLGSNDPYVIVGDLNADPNDGDSVAGAIQNVLEADRANRTLLPLSLGAVEANIVQGGINDTHVGSPGLDTTDFGEPPGNLRVDYVIPSTAVSATGVFWPVSLDSQAPLVLASDHRMVWADLYVSEAAPVPPRFTEIPLDGLPETIRSEETNLGNLVADAVLFEGLRSHEAAGAPAPTIALHNGGNIRNGTLIPVGEMTDALIAAILMFDNDIVIVEGVRAQDLHDLLEVAVADLPKDFNGSFAHMAGLRFTWDPAAEPLSRVTDITALGDPNLDLYVDGAFVVDPVETTFVVATNDFVASFGNPDGWPLGQKHHDVTVVADSIRVSLIDYIEQFPDMTVPATLYPEGMNERIFQVEAAEL